MRSPLNERKIDVTRDRRAGVRYLDLVIDRRIVSAYANELGDNRRLKVTRSQPLSEQQLPTGERGTERRARRR